MTEQDIGDTRRTLPWWGEMLRFLTLGLLTVGIAWTLSSTGPLDWNLTLIVWIMTAAGSVTAMAAFAIGAFELAQRCVRHKD
nr:hypothetical protein OG690_38540 [Streptomyces tubercidicus]